MSRYYIFSFVGIKKADKKIFYGNGNCILEDVYLNKKDIIKSARNQEPDVEAISIVNIMEVSREDYEEWVR